ncbi:SDR family NAD(P)-dependent oxidoreductase [Dyadobacter subterraneus]|uniref:SDR family NAD(P)-dependent oxidoreductase n=1 Tax=Dyadobacter subterraneus TaxID=2773304 RepID=A0ABR9WFF0_9BACT|nr:SDR family NAD(P)-dependent oxidoreductase [Dyadobacter subterraneus]MBE9464227.1 SDR family NAD(P)-dependent oxidoreductase [Dyadobacter subterraneus]
MKNNDGKESIISAKTALLVTLGAGLFALAKTIYKEINKFDLKDKVVIITGGSRGLGLAIARELASKGAKLALCARTASQLENARLELEELGAEVITIRMDVSNQTEVQRMIKAVYEHYGQLDVLINNAGIIMVGPENVMEIQDYKKVMDTNLWSALYTIKASLPIFLQKGEGRIVNIASIGGKVAVPHLLPYSVSKFALVGLSEGLNAELKKDNIHVTTVIPNLMQTGSPRNVTVKGDHESEYAWFKLADSSSLLSQKAESAAKEIVKALEQGENELILTQMGKVAVALQGILPGSINALSQVANHFLPKGNNRQEKKGFESESELSNGAAAANTDKAAVEFNEI